MVNRPAQIDVIITDEAVTLGKLEDLLAARPELLEEIPELLEVVIELEVDCHGLEFVSLNEREATQQLRLGHVDKHLRARRADLEQWQPHMLDRIKTQTMNEAPERIEFSEASELRLKSA